MEGAGVLRLGLKPFKPTALLDGTRIQVGNEGLHHSAQRVFEIFFPDVAQEEDTSV
jgi:hypothetical protein